MNIQKITNITVVVLAVVALIVLGVIIGQGDEYIESFLCFLEYIF